MALAIAGHRCAGCYHSRMPARDGKGAGRSSLPVERMHRFASLLMAALLFALGACDTTPTRWQRAGTSIAAKDEADCRDNARQEAVRQMPYGNGQPIFFHPKVSMLQWTLAIANERSWL